MRSASTHKSTQYGCFLINTTLELVISYTLSLSDSTFEQLSFRHLVSVVIDCIASDGTLSVQSLIRTSSMPKRLQCWIRIISSDMIRGRPDKEQLVAMWELHTKLAFDEAQNPEASAEPDTPVDVLEFPGELGKGIIRNGQTRLDGWTKPSQPTEGTWLLNQFLDERYPDTDGEDFVMEDDEDVESYREQARLASSNPRRRVSSDVPDGDDEV